MSSGTMVVLLTLLGLIGLWILVGMSVLHRFDRRRIRAFIAAQGGELQSVRWEPFGPGWPGSSNERIYRIRYRGPDGSDREARCVTSTFGEIYLRPDDPLPLSPPATPGVRR